MAISHPVRQPKMAPSISNMHQYMYVLYTVSGVTKDVLQLLHAIALTELCALRIPRVGYMGP